MLELYYNFFANFPNVNTFEVSEMDTDSLCLALAEKGLNDSNRHAPKTEWERLRSKNCIDSLTADATGNFFLTLCSDKHKKKHDKREPGFFKEEFRCTERLRLYQDVVLLLCCLAQAQVQ